MEPLEGLWEKRWHPLREEWVVVAAHRQDRPWRGETMDPPPPRPPRFDPSCHFCPGNARVSGVRNPSYSGVLVFDNDHPCVGEAAPSILAPVAAPFRGAPARGVARVVCYSPRHDLTLAELALPEVDQLLATWQEQFAELAGRAEVDHVLIFENKGEVVGVSNPHPHGQIYATDFVFRLIEVEAQVCARHHQETGGQLFEEIVAAERADGRRVIFENDQAIAFVPHFARYAFEAYVAPRGRHQNLTTLNASERHDLAEVLRELTIRYDNLWQRPFPYVMAAHQAPTDGRDHPGFQLHFEFHPPLRKPGLLKYLAGPEIGGGNFLADTSPEAKAAELRGQDRRHYSADEPSGP